jgi:ketosteroid isomerase-like protein
VDAFPAPTGAPVLPWILTPLDSKSNVGARSAARLLNIQNKQGVNVMDISLRLRAVKTLPAVMLIVALTVPAFAQNARSVADEWNQKWVEAYDKGDAAGLTSLYTKDAVLIGPSTAEPVVGDANIRKFFDNDLIHPVMGLSIKSTDSKMLDPNTIIDAGTWAGDVPGEKGGAPIHIAGVYIQTFVHQGSDWLLRTEAANMLPPPKK